MKNLSISALAMIFFSISIFSLHPYDAVSHDDMDSHRHVEENSPIWTKYIEMFQKYRKADPDAARDALRNIAEHIFCGHVLTEEWLPLYFRVNQTSAGQLSSNHISDIKRVFELELRMLVDIDAEKYANQIQQHRDALKYYTDISVMMPTAVAPISDSRKRTSIGRNEQKTQSVKELYATGEQHLRKFREMLPTDREGAAAELDTYTALIFRGHALIEEWKQLYEPIVQNQGALLPEIIRFVETEKQMLTDTDAQLHAERIKTLTKVEKSLKWMGKMYERQGILHTKFVPFTIE